MPGAVLIVPVLEAFNGAVTVTTVSSLLHQVNLICMADMIKEAAFAFVFV